MTTPLEIRGTWRLDLPEVSSLALRRTGRQRRLLAVGDEAYGIATDVRAACGAPRRHHVPRPARRPRPGDHGGARRVGVRGRDVRCERPRLRAAGASVARPDPRSGARRGARDDPARGRPGAPGLRRGVARRPERARRIAPGAAERPSARGEAEGFRWCCSSSAPPATHRAVSIATGARTQRRPVPFPAGAAPYVVLADWTGPGRCGRPQPERLLRRRGGPPVLRQLALALHRALRAAAAAAATARSPSAGSSRPRCSTAPIARRRGSSCSPGRPSWSPSTPTGEPRQPRAGRAPSPRRPARPASSRRERTPSLRYALERCTSTVFGVTKSICAMSRFEPPSAARLATRRSLAVSDSTPRQRAACAGGRRSRAARCGRAPPAPSRRTRRPARARAAAGRARPPAAAAGAARCRGRRARVPPRAAPASPRRRRRPPPGTAGRPRRRAPGRASAACATRARRRAELPRELELGARQLLGLVAAAEARQRQRGQRAPGHDRRVRQPREALAVRVAGRDAPPRRGPRRSAPPAPRRATRRPPSGVRARVVAHVQRPAGRREVAAPRDRLGQEAGRVDLARTR